MPSSEIVNATDLLQEVRCAKSDEEIAAFYRYSQARADLAHAFGEMESTYGR